MAPDAEQSAFLIRPQISNGSSFASVFSRVDVSERDLILDDNLDQPSSCRCTRCGRHHLVPESLLVASFLSFGFIWLCIAADKPTNPLVEAWTGVQKKTEDHRRCHTAKKGETCWKDVDWAMDTGLKIHPEWYAEPCPRLKLTSSFEEFQSCIVRINRTTCELPCNPAGAHISKETHHHQKHKGTRKDPCHIAGKNEQCYREVVEVMMEATVDENKFKHLGEHLTFEDFQSHLHQTTSVCPRPCKCKMAEKDSTCYEQIVEITENGDEEELQDAQRRFHKDGKYGCPLPCSSVILSQADLQKTLDQTATGKSASGSSHKGKRHHSKHRTSKHDLKKIEKQMEKDQSKRKKGNKKKGHVHCMTTHKKSKCHKDVVYGMHTGIHEHPGWYPGLTPRSAFENFQAVLAKNDKLHCPEPCACRTARPGDVCHDHISWVLNVGLEKHPKWYDGLSETSTLEEVQTRIHEDTNTTCERPCTPRRFGSPSLFCFSVFRSEGYELDLVKAQVAKNVGIFSCDGFATLSDEDLPVANDIRTLKIPPSETVGISKDGTAANTLIFMQAWNVIYQDARWRSHDFTIKADPDAVLLPARVRHHLRPHIGKNVFITNCGKWHGPGWPMMFGSLEAFSRKALQTYYRGAKKCRTELEWQAWGEDLFMGKCLWMLGAKSAFDGHLISDGVCTGVNCRDGVSAAYHPFKSAKKWFECYHQAMGSD